jgi:signal transduction histidine kinase
MSYQGKRKEGNNINMEDLSLHILDIAENSIRAHAKNVKIVILENAEDDLLTLTIEDDGEGMDGRTKENAVNPFFTTKQGKKTGLGLAFLSQSAEEANGTLKVESEPGKGTRIQATFRLGHIDRKPFGNLNDTIKCLKIAHPEIHITFNHFK